MSKSFILFHRKKEHCKSLVVPLIFFIALFCVMLLKAVEKKPSPFGYCRSNLTYLNTFFNLVHNLKVRDMSLISQFQKFNADLIKECEIQQKTNLIRVQI